MNNLHLAKKNIDFVIFGLVNLYIFISGIYFFPKILGILIFIIILITIFKRPYFGLYYYISFLYNYPLGLGIPYIFQIIALSSIIFLLLKSNLKIKIPLIFRFLLVINLIFFLLIALSYYWAKYPDEVELYLPYVINSFITFLFFYLLLIKSDVSLFLKIYGILGAFGTIIGFSHSVLFENSYMNIYFIEKGLEVYDPIDGIINAIRWIPPFKDPNYYASTLLIPLFINIGFWIRNKNLRSFVLSLLSVVGVALTFSRSTFISMIFGFLLLLVFSKKIISKYTIYIALLFMVLILLNSTLLSSIQSISVNISDSGGSGRFSMFKEAIEIFVSNPILGIGYWQFHLVSKSGFAVHNTYLETLVSFGIIGTLLLLIIVLFTLYFAYKSIEKRNDNYSRMYSLQTFVFAGILSYLINLNTISLYDYSLLVYLLPISYILYLNRFNKNLYKTKK